MKLIKVLSLICSLFLLFASCKVSDSNNEEKQISYYIPTVIITTLPYEVINDVVNLSTISFHIPQNFELESESGELLLKYKGTTVELIIEDKTDLLTDFDEYIQETIDSLIQMGLSPSVVEETDIRNNIAKRFTVNTFDTTSSNVRFFCYFIEINNSKIIVNVTSKDGEIITVEQADEMINKIEFTEIN